MKGPLFLVVTILLTTPARPGLAQQPARQRGVFHATASTACGSCHPRHYREWLSSVHAHMEVPTTELTGSIMEDTTEMPDPICRACHGSLQELLENSIPRDHPLDLSHGAERVISCTTCHQFGGDPMPGRREGESSMPAGMVRTSILKPFHRSKSMASLRQAETCGPCHDVTSPQGVPVERTFSQYLASVYPTRSMTCASCHMRTYVGWMVTDGPLRYMLHRHDMIGVDVAHQALPEAGPQIDRVLAFLRPALKVDVRLPDTVVAGEELDLALDLKNTGAGHNFPAGPAGQRRMWIEVRARAGVDSPDPGEPFFTSGAPGVDGDPLPDSQLVELADRLVDASGHEVDSVDRAVRVEERSLRAMETRTVNYRVPVGLELGGSRIWIDVRVLFRSTSLTRLRQNGLYGIADRYPVLEIFRSRSHRIAVVDPGTPTGVIRVPEDRELAGALELVPPGGTLLVGPGVYTLQRPLRFSGKGITLRGTAGAERTILRMAAAPLDPARASVLVFEHSEGFPGARDVVQGITIEGGRGTLMEDGRKGGGVLVDRASVSLLEVTIRENLLESGDGGGIHAVQSSLDLVGVRLIGNRVAGRGGGLSSVDSVVRIVGCRFVGNSAGQGGGVASAGSTLVLDGVLVQGNSAPEGGGMALFRNRNVEIKNCQFLGNLANLGGALAVAGPAPVVVERTLIAGNLAFREGGGMALRQGARPGLNQVTLVQNIASSAGGVSGGRERNGGPTSGASIRNSIIWNNRPKTVNGSVEHSLVDDRAHQAGTNAGGPPLFQAPEGEWVDCRETPGDEADGCVSLPTEGEPGVRRRWINGDYRLIPGSPAIDAGDPLSPPDPDGTRADLGAFHLPQPARSFIRGDPDGDGRTGLPDLLLVLRQRALHRALPCADAADLDDNGRVEILDLLWLTLLEFGLARSPGDAAGTCGVDPDLDDGLGCFESPASCR